MKLAAVIDRWHWLSWMKQRRRVLKRLRQWCGARGSERDMGASGGL